jgi:hypothetical protein
MTDDGKPTWAVTCFCGQPMHLVHLKRQLHIPMFCHCGHKLNAVKSYMPHQVIWRCKDDTTCMLTMEAHQIDVTRDGKRAYKGDPLGIPASFSCKNLRLTTHALMKQLLKRKPDMTLQDVYGLISKNIDLPVARCHMSQMGIGGCRQAIMFLQTLLDSSTAAYR